MSNRFRTWAYYWIDTADTWCLRNPGNPLAKVTRRPVALAWAWMMDQGTWTAVGDDTPNPSERVVPCKWDSNGDAIDWMRFSRTHEDNDICDEGCVIHNRTDHHMALWTLIWRADRGIFERLCPKHGVGHYDPDQLPYWRATDQMWQTVHGCCGCCSDPDRKAQADDE